LLAASEKWTKSTGLELGSVGGLAGRWFAELIKPAAVHAKGLLSQRVRAREQRLMLRLLALSPDAQAYYEGLEQKRLTARHHVRKIVALSEIYPLDAVARAISDGLAYQAFSAESSPSRPAGTASGSPAG